MSNTVSSVNDRRKNTRSRVFQYIYSSPVPCSKKDIANDLDLSLPTVYQNVGELMDAGYIEYCGQQDSSGGRPAMEIKAVYDVRSAIGIYISNKHLRFISTDLSKSETGSKNITYHCEIFTPEFERLLFNELESFIDDVGIDRNRLLGVGICIPGIVAEDIEEVIYAPTLSLHKASMSFLSEALPYNVHFENDANAGAFAEWYDHDKERSITYLSLSNGVGGSVVVNGGRYSGSNGRAGEFGHMCVEPNGALCACGKRGCLEAYCSPSRLSVDLGMTLDQFFDRLSAGDILCSSVWEKYIHYLSIGIHNIRMAFDCEVVLGGILSDYIEPYLQDIKNLIIDMDPFSADCSYLSVSRHQKSSSMLGAALYYINSFMDGI